MTIGGSLFLIIVGAILRFAVTAHVASVDLQTVGLILMIGGAVGLVIGLAMTFATTRRTQPGRRPPGPPEPPAY
ncbi:DUF6458 family protein [Conexibacter sp. CPCC 206217]|uniref:DUF6458 family protein n=1 Tax=Conexibacter sp. CPCC 206217 TaxID=3064574 RepID=UPI00271D2536|nr:DUF6458 family protein [Conexibacter sp. CPCC 206217]MDO8212207.1 DUF6458 family protein [Conexibacter sp. CPCC 206217]